MMQPKTKRMPGGGPQTPLPAEFQGLQRPLTHATGIRAAGGRRPRAGRGGRLRARRTWAPLEGRVTPNPAGAPVIALPLQGPT